ncbi:MAG: hypothetical protein ABIJ25_14375 [Pseudomonadota bacterium]
MNKKRYLGLASVLTCCLLLLLISGCGSSGNKEGDAAATATVSETSCVVCHSTSLERLTAYQIVAKYTPSIHNVSSVGCQDCHGAGGSHNGVGPIPYPSPGYAQCTSCHDSGTATDYALVTKYSTSKHLLADTEDGRAKCNRCHTHQGAVLSAISNYTGDGNVMAAMVGAPGVIANPEPIKCNTCHETHDAKKLRVDTAWLPSTTVGAAIASTNAQFRLCTQCHGYTTPAGLLMGSGTAASGTALASYHDTSWYRIIGTTHYDNPATGYGLAANLIEGYVLRHGGTNPNPCLDCHGHEALAGTRRGETTTPTIYTDWAQSGHGGGMLTAKYAAAAANPVTGTRGSAEYTTTGHAQVDAVMAAGSDGVNYSWAHYPWNNTTSRGTCQKCHTATGAANYMDSPTTYAADGSGNLFTHLSGWTPATGSPQAELLYCWGCHSKAGSGALRNPGAVTSEATYQGAAITYSDGGKSNGCYVCHGGRGDIMGARSSRFMAHHAPAATTLFSAVTKVGYQYAGLSYSNPSYFAHDTIGITAGDGPCVTCHMKSSSSHSFGVVTKTAGVITAIKTQATCDGCHTGNYVITAAKLEEESEGYQQAGTILLAYVANTITNYLGVAVTSANYRTVAEGAYGAFQNAKLHTEEPGGFAHNRYYVKRLIFDSIDWMDNGALDGTITINATTYPKAAEWFGAPAGTTGSYAATRP